MISPALLKKCLDFIVQIFFLHRKFPFFRIHSGYLSFIFCIMTWRNRIKFICLFSRCRSLKSCNSPIISVISLTIFWARLKILLTTVCEQPTIIYHPSTYPAIEDCSSIIPGSLSVEYISPIIFYRFINENSLEFVYRFVSR